MVAIDQGASMTMLLVDLGRGGMQTVFPPGETIEKKQLLGKSVTVSQLPAVVVQATGIGDSVRGNITWVSPQRCGIRFACPLDIGDEELSSLLESL
jgi:hypothetical protein